METIAVRKDNDGRNTRGAQALSVRTRRAARPVSLAGKEPKVKRALIAAALVVAAATGCANTTTAAQPPPPPSPTPRVETIDPNEQAAFIAQRTFEDIGVKPTDVECGDRPIEKRPGEKFICSGRLKGEKIWWVVEQQTDSLIFYPYGRGR
jgi:hypothetical protein